MASPRRTLTSARAVQIVATISWGLEWLAWAGVDECNRALNDEEVGVNATSIQLTTKDNVPPEGQGYEVDLDYKAKFKELWGS